MAENEEGNFNSGSFVCELCFDTKKGIVKPDEKIQFFNQVDFVKSSCYLGDRLNIGGGSEAAVTARLELDGLNYRMCGVTLWEKVFVENERIYQSCVRSPMLYGSKTWCLGENEMAILKRTEKAVMIATFGVKMIEKKRTQELMSLLGL